MDVQDDIAEEESGSDSDSGNLIQNNNKIFLVFDFGRGRTWILESINYVNVTINYLKTGNTLLCSRRF